METPPPQTSSIDDPAIDASTGPLFTMTALLSLIKMLDKAGTISAADYRDELLKVVDVMRKKERHSDVVLYLEALAKAVKK